MEKNHDLAKWLSGDMTTEELREFEKSPEFESYKKIADFSSKLRTSDFDQEAMLNEIIARPKKEIKVIPIKKWLFSAAAVLVVALGCFFLMQNQTVSENAIAGNMTQFQLPDDSEVTLNSDSEINYKKWNWDTNRNLELSGEAFFKVAKGEKFTVCTKLGSVRVVGTQFSVKARGNRFEIECFEGKVSVEFGDKTKSVSKAEILVIESGNQIDALPTNAEIPAWMQHQIRIISSDLPTIISELERVYNVKLTFKNKIPNQKFTGFLPSDDLATAMEILAKIYNFQYKSNSKNNILIENKRP